jgi:transposase InsO family protein
MIGQSSLPVSQASQTLDVSARGYYKWMHRKEPVDRNALMRNEIHEVAAEFPKYGYRRITHALRRNGELVNHKRVLRIMKEENLLVRRKKFTPKTTQSNHGLPKYPNLVKGVVLTGINQAVVSDITYIRLLCEFVYLAVIMDLFSRRVVGWAVSRNPDTQLTLDALNKAIALRGAVNLAGCIHHSDQGVQYAAYAYVQRLQEVHILSSMGEQGNSYENAFAESLIKTIKYDEVHMNEYETLEDVYRNIRQFIEDVYNKKRLHSSIGYLPPIEFEEKKQEVLNTSSET